MQTRRSLRRAGQIALALLGVFVILGFSLARGSARALPRTRYAVPPSAPRSWREVFDHAPRVVLRSLDTGAVHVSRASMLAASHPGHAAYREEPESLRVFAHLVRHPTRGDVLIDSGLDASFLHDPYGNIQRPARWLIDALLSAPYTQAPDEDVAAQLARLDAHPGAVFFTHLHMDHTAGVPALPASTRLVTGPDEAGDVFQIFGFGHLDRAARLEELDFRGAADMAPLGPALDLFGDGTLWAVSTPGHSRGHVSFVVNAVEGPVLLTGDATHFRWAFEHDIGPMGPSKDDEHRGQESLERLRAFAKAFPEVTVFTGHEAPARRASEAPRAAGSAQ